MKLCPNLIGGGFGDPHITTLDSNSYTFNGLGEYILLDISDAPLQIQCRTDRAVTSNNSLSYATVYSAFAAREDVEYGTLLQVELGDEKDSMSNLCYFKFEAQLVCV